MAVTPQQLLVEAQAISTGSPRVRQFAIDATACITDLVARVAALEAAAHPAAAGSSGGRLPLLLGGS